MPIVNYDEVVISPGPLLDGFEMVGFFYCSDTTTFGGINGATRDIVNMAIRRGARYPGRTPSEIPPGSGRESRQDRKRQGQGQRQGKRKYQSRGIIGWRQTRATLGHPLVFRQRLGGAERKFAFCEPGAHRLRRLKIQRTAQSPKSP